MQAVIMAAGEGKRMRPLTLERPKPLIEVSGKPIIEHVIDALPAEIDELIIVIGYKGDMIKKHLGDSYGGKKIRYVHQWMPAGTAHALSLARPFLSGKFLLLNADDILGSEAIQEAMTHPLSIMAIRHDQPEKFGVIKTRADGTMESIVEKPTEFIGNLVSTGAMVLDDRLFGYEAAKHEATGEYFMTHPLSLMAAEHPVVVVEQPLYIPVGYPEDIPKAEAKLKELGR
ncbi:MAG TPA: nucleotidyltransferase family protein [Candidatus Paceibacterota bacterium]|nr:nucleotidyltransferase family protein [Candidatus Paceibacterota bacterium]